MQCNRNSLRCAGRGGAAWPDIALARRTLVLVKRMAFARSAGEMMDAVDTDIASKHAVAATAVQAFSRDSIWQAVLRNPALASFIKEKKVVAMAVLRFGARLVLDMDAERALKQYMQASLRRPTWDATSAYVAMLAIWVGWFGVRPYVWSMRLLKLSNIFYVYVCRGWVGAPRRPRLRS